jgi:hypothetical protein
VVGTRIELLALIGPPEPTPIQKLADEAGVATKRLRAG